MNEMSGIVAIDINKSVKIKEGVSDTYVQETLAAYDSMVKETFDQYRGEIWHEMGDGRIALFETPGDAVTGCIALLRRMYGFNRDDNSLGSAIFTRIGIHQVGRRDVQSVPKANRGRFSHVAIDTTGHLEKHCPIGRIAISQEVYKQLGDIEQDLFRAALSVEISDPLNAYVLKRRVIMPQEEALLDGLSEEQRMFMPPIPFTTWDKIAPDTNQINLMTLGELLTTQPALVVIGESLRRPDNPLRPAATSDSVGILEIMAALRPQERVTAGLDGWEDTAIYSSNYNIILIGSSMVNAYAFSFNDIIRPVHFLKSDGQAFGRIVVTPNRGRKKYFGDEDEKDYGIVTLSRSPLNLDKALLWIAGITGIGTQAAARFVQDLLDDPKKILTKSSGGSSPVACVVKAKPEDPWGTFNYHGRWKVSDYEISWIE